MLYKNYIIDIHLSGWYSVSTAIAGYLVTKKFDSLDNAKEWVDLLIKGDN